MDFSAARAPLSEHSPLIDRGQATNTWHTRVTYTLATLALVGVVAFAGVATFPRAADIDIASFTPTSGDVADGHNSAPNPIRAQTPRVSRSTSKHVLSDAPKLATQESSTVARDEDDEDDVYARIAQLEDEKAMFESSNAELLRKLEALTSDDTARVALEKCHVDRDAARSEASQAQEDLAALEKEIDEERAAHLTVGGFNCGRIVPGENRDEKLEACDKELRIQFYERRKANSRKYQWALQNDALRKDVEALEVKVLELDDEARTCTADAAEVQEELVKAVASAHATTAQAQASLEQAKEALERCARDKEACDEKTRDAENDVRDAEAREDACAADFARARETYRDSHATKDEVTKQLQADISRLETKLDAATSRRASLEKTMNETRAEIQTCSTSLERSVVSAASAAGDVAECEKQRAATAATVDHLKNDAKRMEQTLNVTRQSKLVMVDEVRRLNDVIEDLERQVFKADAELADAVQTAADEKEELIGMSSEKDKLISSVKTENAYLKAQINITTAAERKLHAKLDEAQTKAVAAQKDLEDEIDACQSEFAEARKAYAAKHTDNAAFTTQLKASVEQLETQLANVTAKCKYEKSTFEAEIHALNEDISVKIEEIEHAVAEAEARGVAFEECVAASDAVRVKNVDLMESAEALNAKFKSVTAEKTACEGYKKSLLDENVKLEASVEQCEADGATEREVLLAKHADKDEVAKQLGADLKRTQGEVSTCLAAEAAANARIESYAADINACKNKTKLAETDFENLRAQPWCQPPNPPAPPPVPKSPPVTPAGGLGIGMWHLCAFMDDKTVECLGYNYHSQLGDGKKTDSLVPLVIPDITDAVPDNVGGGRTHACALMTTGKVKCWGGNYYGTVGDGTYNYYYNTIKPVEAKGITDAVSLRVSDYHNCVIRKDGTVWCWGWNVWGCLGYGSAWTHKYAPMQTAALGQKAKGLGLGYGHSCALLEDETVKCWGGNNYGQLGLTGGDKATPGALVHQIKGAVAVDAGYWHSCALLKDGTVRCWGNNQHSQLGVGTVNNGKNYQPVAVHGIETATQIATGDMHSCALLEGGTIQCWGNNQRGQCGDGTNTSPNSKPVTVKGIDDAVGIAVGFHESCAFLADGTTRCWGWNDRGQLGNRRTKDSNVPVASIDFTADA